VIWCAADCTFGAAPLHPIEHGKRAVEIPMRAEIERLVEEIKQSVGLLRRHL
jgi:hypothetical protein